MTIGLDETDKLISIILGGVSLLGIFLKKWVFPNLTKWKNSVSYWLSVPKRLKELEIFVRDVAVKNLDKELPIVHSMLYILKYKSDFLLGECDTAMWECNIQGDCVWANESLLNIFGVSHDHMVGTGWLNALHPDDIQPVSEKWRKSIELKVPYKARYRVINQKTNEILFCQSSGRPIYDETGKILSYLGKVDKISKDDYEE